MQDDFSGAQGLEQRPQNRKTIEHRLPQGGHTLSPKTQILIYLAVLAVLDAVLPIPITAMGLIMVLFQKPRWFKAWVEKIYRL